MSETIGVNVLQRAQDMQVSDQLDGYSGVRIYVGTDDDGNEIVYESGNTDGNVLEVKNAFGTQAMADNILADILGYQYQPMSATAALLNPAAEMGDGVTVNGVYSGVFTRNTTFGRLMASDISAPTSEEIEHEFAIESPSDRQYTRFVQQTKSMLKITNLAIEAEVAARTEADEDINSTLAIHATNIAAKVSKQGGDGSSTFGWNLTDSEWTVFSGSESNTILKASASGLEVKGKITATSGEIGGFTIGSTSIYSNGMSSMSSAQTTGVHIGTDGIKLGQKFTVDTSGNVTASGITATGIRLQGTLTFLNSDGSVAGTMTAADLRSRVNYSYGQTTSGGYCYGGAGAGYSAQTDWSKAKRSYGGISYIYADGLGCGSITANSRVSAASLSVGGTYAGWVAAENASMVLGW